MTVINNIVTLGSSLEQMEGGGKSRFTVIDHYELHTMDLKPYICLTIGGHCDQEYLTKHKNIIRSFLDDGKIIVFGGHLFRPWLPGGSNFIPREIKNHGDYQLSILQDDLFFMGVDTHELTYRKGVAGFVARGHHPLPPGAIPLLALPDGEPTLYIDRNSTKGTLLVSSGASPLGMGGNGETTKPIAERVLAWIREEYAQLQQRVQKEAAHK